MASSTTRGAFPYPVSTDPDNVPADLLALAQKVADTAALYVTGTAATRPAAGVVGRIHRATDTGVVTWDTGSAWDDIAVSRAGGSTITASGAAVKPLVVKLAASQSANALEVQNSAGTNLATITSAGFIGAPIVVAGNADPNVASATLNSRTRSAGEIGLVVRGSASQTANLTEWQDSTGAVLARVNADGTTAVKDLALLNATQSTVAPAAAARWWRVNFGGTVYKIPLSVDNG